MAKRKKLLDSTRRKGPDPRWIYPVRAEVKWKKRKGLITLQYPKDFNRFERFLHRFLGGPADIKRPLDEVGTLLWEMSDGKHSLLEIYMEEQERFHERVEPVDKVVGGLLEIMLSLHLMTLDYRPPEEIKKKKSEKKGRKIVRRASK
ncbi:MAG: hypothetical protein ACMUIG_01230 [Thermoplasmatota archaeon]